MNKETFIEKAKKIHGDKYDYSLVPNVVNSNDDITIICHEKDMMGEEHGPFTTKVCKHINRGDGCPKCSGRYKRTREDFIKEANFIHNNFYSYDNFEYVDTKTKGLIYCPKHGIEFAMTPSKHLCGQGCPKCRYEKSSKSKTKNTEWFIAKAKEIHGNKYDYSKSVYVGNNINVCIICPEHGEFWQTPSNHLHKTKPQGCPVCGRLKCAAGSRDTLDDFVRKAKDVYGDKYDYSKVKYINSITDVEIICPKHGSFWQRPANHLMGEQCPKCSSFRSKGEEELLQFISSIYQGEIITNDRKLLDGDEIDILLNDAKICFEYNGLHWHDEKTKDRHYHVDKTERCNKKGYRLIHIFEDEWLFKKDIVKSRIRSILHQYADKIYARKCELREVTSKDAVAFLEKNHIQGKCGSTIRIGLFYNNELVSLMTFGKTRHFIGSSKHEWELLRFCNKLDTVVIGGASKLYSYFNKTYHPLSVVSYADRRWSEGNLYDVLGFSLYNISQPNYFYIVGNKRKNRFNFRKSELVKQGFDKDKSEHEIMKERGIYRIYDCGCLCYEKKC